MEDVEDASAEGWGHAEQQGFDENQQQQEEEGFEQQQLVQSNDENQQQQGQGWTQASKGPVLAFAIGAGAGGGAVQQASWKGKGKGKEKGTPWVNGTEQLYWGQVRCYNHEKTHGLIFCEDIFFRYGQEVYVYKDVLASGGAGPGDTVVFFLHWSKRDQAQASKPFVRIGTENGFALEGTFKAGSKGFGFFQCDLTMEIFGRDVYVNPDLASQFQLGDHVVFNAKLNRDLMPNALNAEAAPPGWEPTPGDLSQTWSSESVEERFANRQNGKGGGKKGGGGGDFGCGGGGDWSFGGGGGEKGYEGKGGKNIGGYGGGGGKGPPIGAGGGGQEHRVIAPPSVARSGAAQQNSWPPVGGGGGSQKGGPNPTGETYMGVVKSFNAAQNYGFITNEEVQAGYGVDCWVHGSNIGGEGANPGDIVSFELAISLKGSPQALHVKAVEQNSLLAQVFAEAGSAGAGQQNASNSNSNSNSTKTSTAAVVQVNMDEGEIDLAAVEHAILNPGILTSEDYATYMHALQLCADQGSTEAAELATQLESSYTSHVVNVGNASQVGAEGAGPAPKRQKVDHGFARSW